MYHDEHRVIYRTESLYYTPETNISLYANYAGIKIFKNNFKKKKNKCMLCVKLDHI